MNIRARERKAPSVHRLLSTLRQEYGDPRWWPGESAFEVAVGAILTQRVSWANAESAIRNLKSDHMLSPEAILGAPVSALERRIRPSGFFRQKARYLKAFSEFVVTQYNGRTEEMRAVSAGILRDELLRLPGVGPETADSILLYALSKPKFVVDAYTYRLLDRLGFEDPGDYRSFQSWFELALGQSVKDYADMHALIVIHSKLRCRKTPDCRGCPLAAGCRSKREQQ